MGLTADNAPVTGAICDRARTSCRRQLMAVAGVILAVTVPLMGWIASSVGRGAEARADISQRLSRQEATTDSTNRRLDRIETKIDQLLETRR